MKSMVMFAELTKYQDNRYYEKHSIFHLFMSGKTYRSNLLVGAVVDAKELIYTFPLSGVHMHLHQR